MLVAGALVALATILFLWRYADSQIDRIDLPALAKDAQTDAQLVEPTPDTLNVLIVGTDSREGLSEEELLRLGTEEVDGNRTDTIMLVQVAPARPRAVVVSFPRDLRVDVPGEGVAKINGVHNLGGPNLLAQTVQGYTGVAIDHYVEVDIAGFVQLTDAIGGVEVCLESAMEDVYAAVDLPAGCSLLDGYQAAGFVRARRTVDSFGRDDFGRIARQQYFIGQAMDKVTSAGTLLNPVKLKNLIDVVADSITTDKDLSATDMLRLANALKTIGLEDVEMRMVPGFWKAPYIYAYPEQAEALFQSLRDGTSLPDVGLTQPDELVASDVSLAVLNGVGSEGLAAQFGSFIEARGFRVLEVGNADSFEYTNVVVTFTEENRPKAELVAEFVPGAELRVVPSIDLDVDVLVVVGSDWSAGQ